MKQEDTAYIEVYDADPDDDDEEDTLIGKGTINIKDVTEFNEEMEITGPAGRRSGLPVRSQGRHSRCGRRRLPGRRQGAAAAAGDAAAAENFKGRLYGELLLLLLILLK